jgi:hypothetical protein
MHDLIMSNKRAAHRLNVHFMREQGHLYRTQKRVIKRLERSEGGAAARRAALEMRTEANDAVRREEIQGMKLAIANEKKVGALKERLLRDEYARKFREMERSDTYATALHRLIHDSWWNTMYRTSLRRAHLKCNALKNDAYELCVQHVEANAKWLKRNLRKQDKTFNGKYVAFTKKNADSRKAYLEKRRDLAAAYQDALDVNHMKELHSAANHELHVEQEVRKRLMIKGGHDLGKDFSDGQKLPPDEVAASRHGTAGAAEEMMEVEVPQVETLSERKIPKGYHIMADGKIMADEDMMHM